MVRTFLAQSKKVQGVADGGVSTICLRTNQSSSDMKKSLRDFFRGPSSRIQLAIGSVAASLVVILAMQNCSRPYGLDKAEYTPPAEAILTSVQSLDGKTLTNEREFKMTLAYPYAEEVYITADAENRVGSWEPLHSPQTFLLEGDDSTKQIFIKFRNFNKRESDWAEMNVTLDTTAPVLSYSTVPPTITRNQDLNAELSVTDNLSGVEKIECRVDAEAFAVCTEVIQRSALGDGEHMKIGRAHV